MSSEEEEERSKLQIVVARYRENLDWLKNDPFNKYSVIVYNKGGNSDFYKHPHAEEIVLPNIGLEIHSFLFHIINNYDNLAPITAFFQGSIDLPYKYNRAAMTITESIKRNTTILGGGEVFNNIKHDLYNFQADNYQMSHHTNPTTDLNRMPVPCIIRPFGRWYEHLFGDLVTRIMALNHIIAVKKEHILRQPIEFYKNLISFVENAEEGCQPEVVHYFERAWSAIFYPLDDKFNSL